MVKEYRCPQCGDLLDEKHGLQVCPNCQASLKGIVPPKKGSRENSREGFAVLAALGACFAAVVLLVMGVSVLEYLRIGVMVPDIVGNACGVGFAFVLGGLFRRVYSTVKGKD
jgi:hypothetical protein